jgi:hypothetical protein
VTEFHKYAIEDISFIMAPKESLPAKHNLLVHQIAVNSSVCLGGLSVDSRLSQAMVIVFFRIKICKGIPPRHQ